MEKCTLIKVGGKIVEEEVTLDALLSEFAKVEGRKVLTHGGGRSATKVAAQLGIETKMVDGRRVTDAAMLDVVTMVYGGLVNKNIVARLQAMGMNAIGLTGADLSYMLSDKRPVKTVDYGFVGDVKRVDALALCGLIESGAIPVLAPLTHDGKGHLLNTNADTIAGEAAKALATRYEVTLTYCFEKRGVMRDQDDEDSVISVITPSVYERLKADGVVVDGMIPKIDNAFAALAAGVKRVRITRADDLQGGTLIVTE